MLGSVQHEAVACAARDHNEEDIRRLASHMAPIGEQYISLRKVIQRLAA
jgi:hypothetical protein